MLSIQQSGQFLLLFRLSVLMSRLFFFLAVYSVDLHVLIACLPTQLVLVFRKFFQMSVVVPTSSLFVWLSRVLLASQTVCLSVQTVSLTTFIDHLAEQMVLTVIYTISLDVQTVFPAIYSVHLYVLMTCLFLYFAFRKFFQVSTEGPTSSLFV